MISSGFQQTSLFTRASIRAIFKEARGLSRKSDPAHEAPAEYRLGQLSSPALEVLKGLCDESLSQRISFPQRSTLAVDDVHTCFRAA